MSGSPRWILLASVLLATARVAPAAETPGKDPKNEKPQSFSISETELKRLPVPRMSTFPWIGQQKDLPPKVEEPKDPNAEQSGLIDVTSGDVTIAASGPFLRTVEKRRGGMDDKPEEKEILTLQKDVEILQPATGSVLRGQTIKVVRDTASGDMERLESHGSVEIVFGARRAKGETLTYETRFATVKTPAGPRKDVVTNMVTVDGDPKTRKPATLWSGDDAIQAQRFVLDLRRDTFRAIGGALIQITLPTQPDAAPVAPAQNKNAMFPGLSLTSGAKVFLSSDGEFLYEGFSGRIALKRNVQVKQEGFLLVADEMEIQLDLAPPGQTGQAQTGVFAGSLRALQCKGRIEIKTPDQVVHCDQLHYDLLTEHLRMEMNDPKEDVKIYTRSTTNPDMATGIVKVLRRIDIDTRTKNMADTDPGMAPTRRSIVNFNGPIPNPRPSYKTER